MPEETMKILIADDEPMLREVIVEFLESLEDYDLAEVENGIQALEHMRNHPVDCILSDIRMPEMGLEELIVILREEFPEVAVIATSGYSDLDNACSIFERGASDFIGKPLDLDLLEGAIQWIPVRRDLLQHAARLFGADAEDRSLSWNDRFEKLSSRFDRDFGEFTELMKHAQRTARLASIFSDVCETKEIEKLELAALLHEVGASAIQLNVMKMPRPLLGNELRLARMRGKISGRFTDQYLPQLGMGSIMATHFDWLDFCADDSCKDEDSSQKLSCMLGAMNMVDSLLTDRADRKSFAPSDVLLMFKQVAEKAPSALVGQVIEHWPTIEGYYSD